MIKFFKKNKYITVSTSSFSEQAKANIPDNLWIKCNKCNSILYKEDILSNLMVCPSCDYHFRINPRQRIEQIVDSGTFEEFYKDMISKNPLNISDYENKLESNKIKTEENDAVVCGIGSINGIKSVVCVMNSFFLMGSMGSVVGEKLCFSIEKAIENRLPILIFTASGGARMQEGIISLMQMAKVSGALSRLDEEKLLYVTILTDPTTGGVTASFAMLGDIILSEPGTLIGFAGRRVIEKVINEELPANFQTAEFVLEKGFIDKIVHRKDLKSTLSLILKMHSKKTN